ncbi:hypothetical protein [Streptomyces synnematoformans]|uniref:Uncharacterized protein n=1 Tax=Streptomyces synnematoformans TaxID=415721 RepID=A0ABN2YAT2_9ACTN
MNRIAADSLYAVSYRSAWGADPDGPLGHLLIRRLDDHQVVAETPARSEQEARALIAAAEADVRGPADVFESTYGIGADRAADPGPDVTRRDVLRVPGPEPERNRGERIATVDERLTVFPHARDVFVTDQRHLAQCLHPLVSIELSAVDSSLRGCVHLLSPVADLSEEAEAGSDGTTPNWLLFHVDENGLYRLRGNPDLLAEDSITHSSPAHPEAQNQFDATRARWERYGVLVWGETDDPTRQREGWGTDIAVVDLLGGDPGGGNWTAFPPPAGLTLDTDNAVPLLRLDRGRRPFTFVAATAGYPWRPEGADAILLFFEPYTRTAALTYDWN